MHKHKLGMYVYNIIRINKANIEYLYHIHTCARSHTYTYRESVREREREREKKCTNKKRAD
jgi:hypothetical protein